MSAGAAEIAAVVPTLGESSHLPRALAALRAQSETVEIVLVNQGRRPIALDAGLADRVVPRQRNTGFAAGTNAGIAAVQAPYIATVNDDAIVDPGWAAALRAALAAAPAAAAAQGVNLLLDSPELTDGWGIGWRESLQAVQLGHRGPAPATGGAAREIFGVSAAAALYRREALAAAALAPGVYFDPGLGSYYEDVDLALRLRARGFSALCVPAARAHHGSSTTGRRRPVRRFAALHGNRYLVLARALRGDLWRELPGLWARDLRDLGGALLRADLTQLLGIPVGWARALLRLRRYAARGAPLLSRADLLRYPAESQR
ncbi:MAG TPA: glycosyltransferase [Thermoanaerobaculia bacterium]|nr:glycosyltransferase [Thermoanaerobaculia bacterium]